MKSDQTYKNIPCNVITGFLGVGKTTTIQSLLKNKPASESWAILVNEFGQVGLDALLIESSINPQEKSVYIKEIPGGCMCCSAGLPMAVALNQLIKQAKPDRLLIEPTGLGHPKEIINVLSGDSYKGVLDIQNTLTILDARHFSDDRYLSSPVFQQQLSVADIFVFNKSDQSSARDKSRALSYLDEHGFEGVQTQETVNGELPIGLLSKVTEALNNTPENNFLFSFKPLNSKNSDSSDITSFDGYQRHCKQQDAFISWGWVFEGTNLNNRFDLDLIESVLTNIYLSVMRIKAFVYSQDQCLHVNIDKSDISFGRTDLDADKEKLESEKESKIEIIAESSTCFESLEKAILGCRVS